MIEGLFLLCHPFVCRDIRQTLENYMDKKNPLREDAIDLGKCAIGYVRGKKVIRDEIWGL